MAAQPITRTDSNTLSEVDGGGEITQPDVKRRRLDKQASSEGRRRNNIRGQFLRFKEMIPAIKNVKDIEKNEQAMLNAFDTEARQQMARRAMLQKGLADLAQSIKDTPTLGLGEATSATKSMNRDRV